MMSFLWNTVTKRIGGRMIIIVSLILTVGISGTLLFGEQLDKKLNPGSPEGVASNDSGLGVTYLTVTPSVATYYDLGVNTGALVTAITPNSPADQAGIRPGDVIVSYNTVQLDGEAPLYRMMRSCRPGATVIIEMLRGDSINTIEFVHRIR